MDGGWGAKRILYECNCHGLLYKEVGDDVAGEIENPGGNTSTTNVRGISILFTERLYAQCMHKTPRITRL